MARSILLATLGLLLLLSVHAASAAPAAPRAHAGRIVFASTRAENLTGEVFAVGVDRYSRRNLTRTLLDNDFRPRPSPDGRRLLFQRGSFGETRILVADEGGGTVRQVGAGTHPVWSPDGTRIAYDFRGEIFVASVDGSGARRVTSGILPSWSPDGSRLAFVREVDTRSGGYRYGFFLVNVDGSGERPIAPELLYGVEAGLTDAPQWSPDGRHLVVQGADVGGGRFVTVVDAETGFVQRLVPGVHPRWSPDGSLIAFAQAEVIRGIAIVRADGSGLRSLTTGSAKPYISDDYPAWSPDGSRLVFIRTEEMMGQQAFVVGADGAGLRRVTRESSHSMFSLDDDLAWLDPHTIVFSSSVGDNDFDLYAIRSDGSGLRRLTSNDVDEREPAWSPNGRWIAFTRGREGSTSIWVVDANGRRLRRVTPRSVTFAASPSWSPDGRRLVFAGIYRRAAALFVVQADGTHLRRVPGPSTGGISQISVDWSRHRNRLVYAWEPSPLQLFVVSARGGRARQLTRTKEAESMTPSWSPDGRTIAFIRLTPCGHNCDRFTLATITPAGRGLRKVFDGPDSGAYDPAWSPDGRRLIFSDGSRLDVVGRDGSRLSFLTSRRLGQDRYPDWTAAAQTSGDVG